MDGQTDLGQLPRAQHCSMHACIACPALHEGIHLSCVTKLAFAGDCGAAAVAPAGRLAPGSSHVGREGCCVAVWHQLQQLLCTAADDTGLPTAACGTGSVPQLPRRGVLTCTGECNMRRAHLSTGPAGS